MRKVSWSAQQEFSVLAKAQIMMGKNHLAKPIEEIEKQFHFDWAKTLAGQSSPSLFH